MEDCSVYLWFWDGADVRLWMKRRENVGISHILCSFQTRNELNLGPRCFNLPVWPTLTPHEKPNCASLYFFHYTTASGLNPEGFEILKWNDKLISRHFAVHSFARSRVGKPRFSPLFTWLKYAPLKTDTSRPRLPVCCFYSALTNTYNTPSRMGAQPLHVKPLSCLLCSLIKIRFCLCCHIWYGFPACTLGWGPSHSL